MDKLVFEKVQQRATKLMCIYCVCTLCLAHKLLNVVELTVLDFFIYRKFFKEPATPMK